MRKISIIALTLLLWLPAMAGQAQAPRVLVFNVIPAESSFNVFVAKAGLLSLLAHDHNMGIKSFSGTLRMPEKAIGGSSLRMEVDTRSLVVLDANISEGDRAKITRSMHEEVLESTRYPLATFDSAAVADLQTTADGQQHLRLSGDLMLHGVTRRITIPVTVRLEGGRLQASGKYTLRQSDFGIRPYSTAGGAIKVKDEVVLNFRIVAQLSS